MRRELVTLVAALCMIAGGAEAAEEPHTVIGLSMPLVDHPVFQAGLRGAREAADALGIELVVLDAEWHPSKQAADIDALVARHVDGIVVWRTPMASPVQNVEAAVAAGIPVVIADTPIDTDKALAFVGSDDAESARLAAAYVVERLHGRGGILEIKGPPGFAAELQREFEAALAKTGIKILAAEEGGLERTFSEYVMSHLVLDHRRFDGVVALNGDMMLGAVAAVRRAGISPAKKVMLSSDCLPEVLDLIRKGDVSACLDSRFGEKTGRAVRLLVDHLRTQASPAEKVILVKPTLITKANLPNG